MILSCTGSHVVTNVGHGLQNEIRKVYIVFKGPEVEALFIKAFANELTSSLKIRGIETGHYNLLKERITKADTEEINARIHDYYPDVVMRVNYENTIRKNRSLPDEINGEYLGVQISGYPEGPIVWQAFIDLNEEDKGHGIENKLIPRRLIKAMERDQLIPKISKN